MHYFDNFLQCIVSLGRINNYINSEDLDTSNVSRETRDGGCQLLAIHVTLPIDIWFYFRGSRLP